MTDHTTAKQRCPSLRSHLMLLGLLLLVGVAVVSSWLAARMAVGAIIAAFVTIHLGLVVFLGFVGVHWWRSHSGRSRSAAQGETIRGTTLYDVPVTKLTRGRERAMCAKPFIPGAGSDWLLPLYDPLTRLLGVEQCYRHLLGQASISSGNRVLEIGCGTGNLIILAKRLNPGAEFIGIDPDPKALARARRKAQRGGVPVRFDLAFSEQLPFPEASFDRVLSVLMLHHIQPAAKLLALREAFRVLKPGGSLHLADFDKGERHSGGFLARILHSRHGFTLPHIVLDLMRDAGFTDSQEVGRQNFVLGQIAYYKGVLPPSPLPRRSARRST